MYFYSVLCVGPLASLLSTPKNFFYMRVLDNCDFSPSEVNLARPTKSLSFDLEHPVLVINDLIPSPQDLEAEARYVLSIISPRCIPHCHMALSLIFEVKHIITQLKRLPLAKCGDIISFQYKFFIIDIFYR